jgi:hypothetical protein
MVLIMVGAAGAGCAVTTPAEELQLSPDREVHVLFTGGALRAVDLTLRNATSVKLEFRGCLPLLDAVTQTRLPSGWADTRRHVGACDGVVSVPPGTTMHFAVAQPNVGEHRVVLEGRDAIGRSVTVQSTPFCVVAE